MTEPAIWTSEPEFLPIVPPTSLGSHYYPHFIDEETETVRLGDLPKAQTGCKLKSTYFESMHFKLQ